MDSIWIIISCVVGFILLLTIAFIFKNKEFKNMIYKLVVEAEDAIKGTKMGQERFQYVINLAYEYIPSGLQWFFTKERISDIIEWAVAKMKAKLKE